jgi:competence protein ComEC
MKHVLKFVPIQLTFFLVLGILSESYFDFKINFLAISILGSLFFLLISYWHSNKSLFPKIHFNIFTYFLVFLIGISSMHVKNDLNNSVHFSHFMNDENKCLLVVEKVLKPDLYSQKYIASFESINEIEVEGIVLLNIKKDSLLKLEVDERIYVSAQLIEPSPPKNPFQFDYGKYLKNQNINHQVYTSFDSFLKLENRNFSFQGLAYKFRKSINKALVKNGFEGNELGVINALLLGQRQDISKELLDSYAGAGAIHILAVSGLHVGIILLILSFLLKPIERFKNGKLIKLVVIVILLWMFAFIAGMSASVVRAVAMFTAVTIGMTFKRPTNVYNTLIISMFFLLLFNPYFLFDVGFQLSYLAVFAIVWLQPLFYNLISVEIKFFNFFWQLLTVSFAAQIGILPLSIYYFHQFPSLFFISNLLIVPALGLILGGGILVIILALLNILPSFLAKGYSELIHLMNFIIEWVAKQEDFLIKNISFSILMVIASYIFIVLGIRFITKRNPIRLVCFLVSILLFQAVFVFEKRELLNNDELVVFQKSRYSMIGIKNGEELEVFHDLDSFNLSADRLIEQYQVGVGISNLDMNSISIQNLYEYKNQKILIIDSLGIYQLKNLKPEIIILQQSPKINLARAIDSLNPKLIIADGSNYKSFIKRWSVTCEQKNTPFHSTSQKGAYILKD